MITEPAELKVEISRNHKKKLIKHDLENKFGDLLSNQAVRIPTSANTKKLDLN